MTQISLILDDITTLEVDAIVNAANSSLLGGGGVDGAIHKAAGPELLEACKKMKYCATGEAKISKAYQLPASYVIHAVGPIYRNHPPQDAGKLLTSAYTNSLKICSQYQIKRVAFPNISTGVYAFPKKEAAIIALQAVQSFIASYHYMDEIIFCCYDLDNFSIYAELLESN